MESYTSLLLQDNKSWFFFLYRPDIEQVTFQIFLFQV